MPAVLSTLNAPKGPRHSKPYTRQDKIKGRIFWFVPTVNPIALSYQERITDRGGHVTPHRPLAHYLVLDTPECNPRIRINPDIPPHPESNEGIVLEHCKLIKGGKVQRTKRGKEVCTLGWIAKALEYSYNWSSDVLGVLDHPDAQAPFRPRRIRGMRKGIAPASHFELDPTPTRTPTRALGASAGTSTTSTTSPFGFALDMPPLFGQGLCPQVMGPEQTHCGGRCEIGRMEGGDHVQGPRLDMLQEAIDGLDQQDILFRSWLQGTNGSGGQGGWEGHELGLGLALQRKLNAVKAEFERHHGQTDDIGKMIFSSLNEQSVRI